MRTRNEITAEIKAIHAKANKINALQNEGVEGYDHTPDMKELHAELEEAIIREWDAETTAKRRATWNDAAKSGKHKSSWSIQQATGIKFDELKAAIARHK